MSTENPPIPLGFGGFAFKIGHDGVGFAGPYGLCKLICAGLLYFFYRLKLLKQCGGGGFANAGDAFQLVFKGAAAALLPMERDAKTVHFVAYLAY